MFARLVAAADDAPLGGVEGDDAPQVAALAAAAPPDVPVGAPDPLRRRGRPQGFQHTELTKVRMKLAHVAHKHKAVANAANLLGDVLQPGRAEYTVRIVVGGAPEAIFDGGCHLHSQNTRRLAPSGAIGYVTC